MDEANNLTQALSAAAAALGRTRDAEEVVRVAIAETQKAAGVEAASLHLLQPKEGLLILREYAGTTTAFRDFMARLPLTEARLAETAVRERRIVTCDVDAHPTEALRALYLAQGFRYVTAVPVAGIDRILGVMHLASRHESSLTPSALALVEAIGGLVGVALENAALREEMLGQQERLRALAEGSVRAREEEARRIAHELHDESGQLLASVHIALDELRQRVPEQQATIQRLHELLDRVEGQLRRLSRELRPTILDNLGLAPALEWLAHGVAERSGLQVIVRASVERLPPLVETALYRIIQEALTNVIRHAQASWVEIEVKRNGRAVEAIVRDNGRGFDVASSLARRGDRGLGLIGMRERIERLGGRFELVSQSARGTELLVSVPVEDHA